MDLKDTVKVRAKATMNIPRRSICTVPESLETKQKYWHNTSQSYIYNTFGRTAEISPLNLEGVFLLISTRYVEDMCDNFLSSHQLLLLFFLLDSVFTSILFACQLSIHQMMKINI